MNVSASSKVIDWTNARWTIQTIAKIAVAINGQLRRSFISSNLAFIVMCLSHYLRPWGRYFADRMRGIIQRPFASTRNVRMLMPP